VSGVSSEASHAVQQNETKQKKRKEENDRKQEKKTEVNEEKREWRVCWLFVAERSAARVS